MRVGLTFCLLLILAIFHIDQCTTVTFYVDHEIEQPLDYVQISAVIKTSKDSLQQSINDAADIIKRIETIVDAYCHTYAKDKSQCIDNVESSPYNIKPLYALQKNRPAFLGFLVAHEIIIKVKESPFFGKLVDNILKQGVNKINSLEWKPLQEVDGQEIAVVEGIQQANKICEKIGMKLDTIISVQEVTDFGEEEQQEDEAEGKQGEEQEQEQEQQEEKQPLDINDDIIYYKFVVQCHPKKK